MMKDVTLPDHESCTTGFMSRDHRIGFTTHQLPLVLEGEPALDEIIDALITEHQTSQLAAMQEEGHA